MIHISRTPDPPIFESSLRIREEKKVRDFYTKTLEERRSIKAPNFNFAQLPDVIHALVALFSRKCAFCEQHFEGGFVNLAQFRPTHGAVGLDGSVSHDHYWWLAFEWSNLYLACVECFKSKGSRFPVKGDRSRIEASETELRSEPALLLDPCVDFPEEHLIFDAKGLVASSTERGRTTIEVFNLNRSSLVRKRTEHWNLLTSFWSGVVGRIKLGVGPQDVDKKYISSQLDVIRHQLMANQEFLGLARQCFQQWAVEATERWPWLGPSLQEFTTLRTATTKPTKLGRALKFKKPTSQAVKQQISQTVKEFKEHEKAQADYSLTTADHSKFFAQTRYIESVEIKNFKIIKHLKLNFSQTADAGSWLLVLGENGTGKSSLLQAIAIALMGEKERERLGLNNGVRFATYPRNENEVVKGFVKVKLTGTGDPIKLEFSSDSPTIVTNTPDPKVLLLGYSATRLLPFKGSRLAKGSRFSKTDNLFNPSLALTKAGTWLYKVKPPTHFYYVEEALKRLMMLRPGDHFVKTDDGRIQVKAFGGSTVYLEDLSAGYQSVVALSTDIMSVLLKLWDSVSVAEGIVLIDEIDAHLHPRWKMQIVERLRLTFPRVQFLVTSHEPLTLRGLNQQEVVVMTRSARGRVSMIKDELPNPKALRVDQLLTSEYFGLSSTLSPELEVEFNEYYSLLAMRKHSTRQAQRLKELKAKLEGLRLMGDTLRERMMYEVIDEFLARKSKQREQPKKLDQRTRSTLLKMWETL